MIAVVMNNHKRRSLHFVSLILNSFLWILILVFCVSIFPIFSNKNFEFVVQNYNSFFYCFAFSYLIYAIETLTTQYLGILFFKNEISQVEKYISELKSTDPVLSFSCESFHYLGESVDTKYHDGSNTPILILKKQTTSVKKIEFKYHYCEDHSDQFIPSYLDSDFIKFNFQSSIEFSEGISSSVEF